jgi:hypothetical protein
MTTNEIFGITLCVSENCKNKAEFIVDIRFYEVVYLEKHIENYQGG